MIRAFPVLTALVVVLATGIVHGVWTARWEQAPEAGAALARLEHFPESVGEWTSRPAKEDAEALERAGADGWRVRRFSHPRLGSFLVIVMCGRPGPMSVHRPEHCYRGAGFQMTSPAQQGELPSGTGTPAAEYRTGHFTRQDETRTVRLSIVWTWFDGEKWQAPASPRFTFAQLPALYKLYVIREASATDERSEEDLTRDFLSLLLPKLGTTLAAP